MSDQETSTTHLPAPAPGAAAGATSCFHQAAAALRARPAVAAVALALAVGIFGTALQKPIGSGAESGAPGLQAHSDGLGLQAPAPEAEGAEGPVGAAEALGRITPPRVPFPLLGQDPQAKQQYFAELRTQVRWVPANVGKRKLRTPDAASRLLLAKSAASMAGLHEVGLDWRDVYGVINAETTWIPRTGMGKNGVPSLGLAQFEPATARAVGLRNPNDAVEAVHAAAVLLKEAANWSAKRVDRLQLPPALHAAKLREGVSVYYNLSTRGRQKWTGLNTAKLPVETRRHIANVRKGVRQAEQLYARVGHRLELRT